MNNPLDFVSPEKIAEMGLSFDDLLTAYQPSSGGVYHARGAESRGKSLWIAHFYRTLIDSGKFLPSDAVGNLSFKGKYGIGYQVLKGDDLREFLWQMTHVPYRNKIVFIDEIDSEFPARFFADKEQTEIALRLWHTAKLGNYILMSSHIGNSADLIFHLATHYYIYPFIPNFQTNSLEYTVYNRLNHTLTDGVAHDVIPTMLIYNRQELTENTEEEQNAIRPSKRNKKIQPQDTIDDLDLEAELGVQDLS